MDCTECARLAAERNKMQSAHERAVWRMNAAKQSDNVDKYTSLRSLVYETKTDLDLLDKQIARHQGQHTIAAG
jgi:hypothetical protein